MFQTARFLPIVLIAWVDPATAADCLQQIDSITVAFDLPAAQSMAGSQTGSAYYIPPPPTDTHPGVPPPPTETPPGRPGAPRGVIGGAPMRGSAPMGAAPLLAHERLSTAERAKVQSILQQARRVEALGNEPQCFELLHQAQAITKGNG